MKNQGGADRRSLVTSIADTGALILAVVVLGAVAYYHRVLPTTNSDENGRTNSDDQPSKRVFPWENSVKSSTITGKVVPSAEQKDRLTVQISDMQYHTNDVEFLASMTFANGGFRPPSCPCCQ